MEETFRVYAGYVALGLEVIAVLVIACGGISAIAGLISRLTSKTAQPLTRRKEVFVNLGVWLLLGLEFELGADIIRSAISPTWEELGQLGAIALIRTFLNYFLEKDIEKYAEEKESHAAESAE